MSEDTVAATIECAEAGALTSATIMVGAPATERALTFARSHRDIGYGVHLQLVGDGTECPLSDPAQVPGLVDGEGRLLPAGLIRRRAMLGRRAVDQLEREIAAQIRMVLAAGVPVTHVDSHRHVHKLPVVREALRRVLPQLGLRRVRNVQDVFLERQLGRPTYWLGPSWRRGIVAAFETTDHMFMPTSGRDETWDSALLERCARLDFATLEVGVHPGQEEPWKAAERRSLVSFAAAARAAGHELISWREL